VFASTIYLIV